MSEKSSKFYKPLCIFLAGATAFSLKENFDNSKQISALKTDISALTEDYSELEVEYDALVEHQVQAEAEAVYSNQTSSYISPIYASEATSAEASTFVIVYRVIGDTEVFHSDRYCYHIREKADSELIALPIEDACNSGLRSCNHCKPIY